MKKSKDPLPEIKKEFAEGWHALVGFITVVLAFLAMFGYVVLKIIQHLKP
ncbi:MAG: hypothetical protein ABSA76_01315 [Bacteroidales bacterium]